MFNSSWIEQSSHFHSVVEMKSSLSLNFITNPKRIRTLKNLSQVTMLFTQNGLIWKKSEWVKGGVLPILHSSYRYTLCKIHQNGLICQTRLRSVAKDNPLKFFPRPTWSSMSQSVCQSFRSKSCHDFYFLSLVVILFISTVVGEMWS